MKIFLSFICSLTLMALTGCSYSSEIMFPSADDLFVTTGDGNIQKPYTPVGQLIYSKTGYRLPIPILGLIPIADVDPAIELKSGILARVKEMGGDAVINVHMDWVPPSGGILGFGSRGGSVVIYGTVIKR